MKTNKTAEFYIWDEELEEEVSAHETYDDTVKAFREYREYWENASEAYDLENPEELAEYNTAIDFIRNGNIGELLEQHRYSIKARVKEVEEEV